MSEISDVHVPLNSVSLTRDQAASLPASWTDQLTALTEAFHQTYQAHVTALQDTIATSWAAWHDDVAAIQQMVQQLAAMDAQRAELWTALQTRLDHLTTLIPAAPPSPTSVPESVPPSSGMEPDRPASPAPALTWSEDASSPPASGPEGPLETPPHPDDPGLTWNQHDPDPVLPQLVQGL